MTLLCVPIFVVEPAQALADAREARDRGADLVEFRIDSFFHGDGFDKEEGQTREILTLVAQSPIPCIVTCRPVLEGGHYDGPDDARIALFERLGTASGKGEVPPRYIDCELATYTRSANIKQKINLAVDHAGQQRNVSTSLILSSHDFHTRPADLFRQLDRMHAQTASRVVKIAFRARSVRDNLELLDILADVKAHGGKPTIALAMGPFGLLSRVLAPKFDGFLTFATLRASSATAPGQPTLADLLSLYRFRSITSTTAVYGVVGYPVEHSLSPHVHNAGFEAVGHDGVYIPLPVPPEFEHFKASVLDLVEHPHLDLRGLSVTIPHKEHLVRLATELYDEGDGRWHIEPFARACGAANTLTVTRDAKGNATKLSVTNTDAPAAMRMLRDALKTDSLRGMDVLLLGVGGTARALSFALIEAGATVAILNRTHAKAEALAAELPVLASGKPAARAVKVEELAAPGGTASLRAVINATPVGMSSGSSPLVSPLAEPIVRNLPPGCVVADCVYSPLATPLLKHAAASGLKTIDGLSLFVRQAGEQFELWTQRAAPQQLFEMTAREILAARESQPPPPLPPSPASP